MQLFFGAVYRSQLLEGHNQGIDMIPEPNAKSKISRTTLRSIW